MFLTDICGIHYPDHKEKELGVIYHLHNLEDKFRIKSNLFPKDNAEVDSITDLYSGANWMEKEKHMIFTELRLRSPRFKSYSKHGRT